MKNNSILHVIISAVVITIFVACEPEDILFDGPSIVHFNTTTASIEILPEDVTGKVTIEIGATVASNVDRTYLISVNEEASTATKGVEFNLSSEMVTIPANSYIGSFEVTTSFDKLPPPPESIVAVLSIEAGDERAIYNQEVQVVLRAVCSSDLAGTYTVITEGSVGDGSGGQTTSFSTGIPSVEVKSVKNAQGNTIVGAYAVDDISGGYYSVLSGFGSVGPAPATGVSFRDLCNTITIESGVVDEFGDSFIGGGIVKGDSIVLNWQNGYGDKATSIYIKQ